MRWFLVGFLVMLPVASVAHEFYDGWCCSDKDCGELKDSDVKLTPQGYLLKFNGELIEYGKERKSKDGRYHRCVLPTATDKGGPYGMGKSRCFYAPDVGA